MKSVITRWLNRRRDRRETRAQIRWGLRYIRVRYGPDAVLTAWRTTEGRDWYAENGRA